MQDNAYDAHHEEAEHIIAFKTCVLTWLCLLVFTAVTISVASLQLGKWSTVAAVGIASCKASLVLLFFMGLKYDRPIFRWMFLVTAVTVAIYFILTYADVLTR